MKIIVLNGSPRRNGTVATLLKVIADNIAVTGTTVEWIDCAGLDFKPCIGCMKCRESGRCHLPEDDAQRFGEKIKCADGLVVGTPVYWGNMSGHLKMLFDRIVPVLMGESRMGIPVPLHKGKKALIVSACTTPWPFNFWADQTKGAIAALREILGYSGYKVLGTIVKPGTKAHRDLPPRLLRKAERLAKRF